jgi:hypothetical protein
MKTHLRRLHPTLLALAALAPAAAVAAEPPPAAPLKGETLESLDGTRTVGRLEGDPARGFRFVASGTSRVTSLEPGLAILCPGRGSSPASGLPPFSVEMGLGQRISGRLVAVDDREIRLLDVTGEGRLTVARGGASAVVQRPGESQVFQDGFETLDSTRWAVVGEPEVVDDLRVAGARSLRLGAGDVALTHRLDEPFGSGRLELAFHDGSEVVPRQQWFVDLTARGPSGLETVRVVLGWAEESLAVESPRGPALAVQRLARKRGWHRLSLRFGPDGTEVAVDGNELAHGKGFGGPLVEVRLASSSAGEAKPPADLAGHVDDVRLVRFAKPAADLETDVTQDEVRMTCGDQLFGKVAGADGETVRLAVDGRDAALPWGDVAGIYFRRSAAPGAPVEGLLVRVEWRAAPGDDPRDLNIVEGAMTGLTDSELSIATPYVGTVVIPRTRLTALRVVGRGRRLVIDPTAHHLGNEISATDPFIDPPQPEGGVLERTVELPDVPAGAASLVLDVVQVVGEATDLPFSNLVKKGELRTNVKINGEPFDYLNRYITSKNESPERIRLPIPRKLLRPGRNVIRLEQAGTANDPSYLDDIGLLGIALEFAPSPAPAGGPPR